jgi:Protein of unknown function (DUF559)
VPRAATVPPQLRQVAFRGTAVVARGVLTPNQLRGPAWRRLFEDVYVHADLAVSHALKARAAASLVVPGSVVTGPSAAVLWGVDLAGPEDDVELTVPPSCYPRRIPGARVRRARLPAEHVKILRGVRVTTPSATALRLAASLPVDDAVVAIDQLVISGVVGLAAVRSLAAAATGPGSARARRACDLADGLAGSPQETRLRLLIGRSTLPKPVAQHTVRHDGRFVARVDFAWPEHKLVLEYDGLWHAEAGQFAKDRQRLNKLRAAGWQVIHVTAADLHDPQRLVALIAEALTVRRSWS